MESLRSVAENFLISLLKMCRRVVFFLCGMHSSDEKHSKSKIVLAYLPKLPSFSFYFLVYAIDYLLLNASGPGG